MPQFFIDRPVFAWVVALFILLAGALAITQLPVAQYPNVAPPQIEIYAVYPVRQHRPWTKAWSA
jgi:multidrug efflux pump